MVTCWTLRTNAKSEKNARVLLSQVGRHLQAAPESVVIDGDRYSGHRIEFTLLSPLTKRAESLYWLLMQAEQLANSWTLSSVHTGTHAWSTRSRIAGISQLEWRELTASC